MTVKYWSTAFEDPLPLPPRSSARHAQGCRHFIIRFSTERSHKEPQAAFLADEINMRQVRNGSKPEVAAFSNHVRSSPDCVAKVVLQEVSKILRAAGAFFV